MKCRVAVVEGMGQPFHIEEMELADPGWQEVRLKVMTARLPQRYHGSRRARPYEGSATAARDCAVVDAVGPGVTNVNRRTGHLRRHRPVRDRGPCLEGVSGSARTAEARVRQPGPYTQGRLGPHPDESHRHRLWSTPTLTYPLCKIDDESRMPSWHGLRLHPARSDPEAARYGGERASRHRCGGVRLSGPGGPRVGACHHRHRHVWKQLEWPKNAGHHALTRKTATSGGDTQN